MELLERLNEVFCDVFDDDELRITPGMTANDVDGWDSLSHVNLIVAVESRFDIRFSRKEIVGLKNIGDLLACIRGKVQQ